MRRDSAKRPRAATEGALICVSASRSATVEPQRTQRLSLAFTWRTRLPGGRSLVDGDGLGLPRDRLVGGAVGALAQPAAARCRQGLSGDTSPPEQRARQPEDHCSEEHGRPAARRGRRCSAARRAAPRTRARRSRRRSATTHGRRSASTAVDRRPSGDIRRVKASRSGPAQARSRRRQRPAKDESP